MQKQLTLTLICFIHLLFINDVWTIGNEPSGARSLALSHANVTLHDIWSTNNNQAGLTFLKNFEIGFSYENRFGLTELGLKNLNVALPIKFGVIGLTIQQFGFTDYSENKFGLAYALKVSNHLSIGVQLDYLLTTITETRTKNKTGITAEIGLLANITDDLTLGVHVFNLPNSSLSGDFDEKIPMIISIGLNYTFSEKLTTVFDIEKNIDLNPNVKLGIEYHPIKSLYFRGGLSTFDFKLSFGVGINIHKFNMDFAINHQTYLGYISSISLRYSLTK